MIQAAILDMDGLLIDSEPFWQLAEQEIFSSLGVQVRDELYQSAIILNHFEGLNLSLPALKISDLEQLDNEIFALLSTRFYCLKIDHFIKRIGIS